MHEISISDGRKIIANDGDTLLASLLNNGIFIESPCGGRGKCGKCRVKITDGTEQKTELACLFIPEHDIAIELPRAEREHNILSEGYMPEFTHDVKKNSYGLAVDIGTTTVAASLIDFMTGREIATAAMINPQRNQGLDVLSRITYAIENGQEGRDILQRSITGAVEDMACEVCNKNNIPYEKLSDIAISANTTMLHLFWGADPYSLGVKPFKPVFTESMKTNSQNLGIKKFNAEVFSLPSVSAYIGADITAGAYVCRMSEMKDTVLFIDIGTNGEMILAHDGKLVACSCAAGPALEGMNISCGMRASEGAIEDINISDDGKISLKVIGDTEPEGICGSGILSAIREFLKASLIARNGRILNGEKKIRLSEKIFITQGDIRQVQLAKGAILSGIKAMLNSNGLDTSEIQKIIVAGQFGAHLPSNSLTKCGLVPDTQCEIKYAGNTSKTGAVMALLSKNAINEMDSLARSINYIELAEVENYERLFARCMEFPAQ